MVIQLAAHLARLGHSVEVWTLRPLADLERTLFEPSLTDAGVQVVPSTSAGLRVVDALLRREVDVVHLHSVFSPYNSLLARRLRVPYVLSPHGGYAPVSLTRSRLRKALYALAVEKQMVRRAALTVALTATEAADLAAFGATGPIRIIPNGVTPAPPEVDTDAFRQQLRVDPVTPLLLFVGRLDVFHKGLDRLVDGLAAAPRWHAVLVGADFRGGWELVRRRAEKCGVRSRLTYVGPLRGRNLDEAFAAARLFVLPSRWEGHPISLLEALSHGLPALVSPPVEEAIGVAGAGAGWVATPADLGDVLNQLGNLDASQWQAAAQAARRLAGRFQWATIARQYADAYARCLVR